MKMFFIIALVATLFWGCEKVNDINDAPYWGIDKELLTFEADGGKEVVKVSSNCRWIITGGDSWCTPSIDRGNGNMSIIFTAAKNDATRDLKTTFYFEFEGEFGTEIAELEVVQEALQVDDAATLMDDAVFIAYCYENFDLNKDGTISMMEANTVKVIEIEDEPKLKSVKGISLFTNLEDISFKNTGLQSIDLSKNTKLTTIRAKAFYDCSSLTSVAIPDSVTKIGDSAFCNCSSLASVTIPDSVSSIGNYTFSGCSSWISITIPNSVISIGSFAFKNCKGELIINSKVVELYRSSTPTWLRDCKFTKLIIGDNITKIGNYAFENCSSLTSVTIPDSVTSIGYSAFSYCSSLANVTIPDSVTEIGGCAFYDCSSLTSVTIGNSVTSIGDSAFSGCRGKLVIDSKFIEISFRDSNYKLTNNWIAGAKFSTIIIGDNVTKIGRSAFENCSSLASVTIGNSVTLIDYQAFYNCSSLKSVTIPDSVTEIGGYAFYDCSSLTSVIIGNGVASIGHEAFFNCSSLKSVTIPDSVTSIGEWAFSYCSSLTSVTIGNSVTSIGVGVFANCQSLTGFYGKFASTDNRCLLIDGVLHSFAPSGLTEYTIDNKVSSIYKAVFYGCSGLTSITIPGSVTEIESSAFSGCEGELIINSKIVEKDYTSSDYPMSDGSDNNYVQGWLYGSEFTKLTIGDNVTQIGNSAFEDCSSLTSLTIPDSVTSIGNSAFGHCSSLTRVTIPDSVTSIGSLAFCFCSSLTKVTIGNEVTSIGSSAFYYCSSLTSVTIPDSVTSIGSSAFYCCSSLTSVYCKPITPPTAVFGNFGWDAFDYNASDRDILVPDASVELYRVADGWKKYSSDIR